MYEVSREPYQLHNLKDPFVYSTTLHFVFDYMDGDGVKMKIAKNKTGCLSMNECINYYVEMYIKL